MEFVIDFLKIYASGLRFLSPILVVLIATIVGLGLRIGAIEGWSRSNALYFAFITATSVGYGDFHPTKHRSKWLAIAVALVGVLLTGIIVSIGLEALSHAFREVRGVTAPMAP